MKTTTRIASATFATAIAVALAGCGDDDNEPLGDVPTVGNDTEDDTGEAPDEGSDTGEATGAPDDADATGAADAGEGGDATDDPTEATDEGDDSTEGPGGVDASALEGQNAAAYAAIELAEQEVGGVAYELDDEDDGSAWKVDVNVDGTDHEVTVNGEGTEVISSSSDGAVDSDDLGKLQVVTLNILDALVLASEEVSGDVVAIDLNTENGVVVWEIEFEDGQIDREVYLNAQSGEVVKVEEDD